MPRKYDVAVNEAGRIGIITNSRARRRLDTSVPMWAGRYVEGRDDGEDWLSQCPRTILSGRNKGRRGRLMQSSVWAVLSDLIQTHIRQEPLRGIEVGVYEAETSCFLLERFPWLHMTLVDPYVPARTEGMRLARFGRLTQDDLDGIEITARANMAQFPAERQTWMRMDSQEAWIQMAGSPRANFIFLDHDHTYSIMRRDLQMYWHQLSPGGVYCGHDYGSRFDQQGVWGVTRAVDEFVMSLHGVGYAAYEHGGPLAGLYHGVDTPSRVWWIVKPPDWQDTPESVSALRSDYIADLSARRAD